MSQGRARNDFLIAIAVVFTIFACVAFLGVFAVYTSVRNRASSEQLHAANAEKLSGLVVTERFVELKGKSQIRNHIHFTLVSSMKTPVSRIKFVLMVEEKGRSTPYSKEIVDFSIPGGIEPGETKELKFEPTIASAFGRLQQLPETPLLLMIPVAAYDAGGKIIADESHEARGQLNIP